MPGRPREYIVTVLKLFGGHVSGWVFAIISLVSIIASAILTGYGADPKMLALVLNWTAGVSGVAVVFVILMAQYDAWKIERTQYEQEVAKNSRPEIKGHVFDLSVNAVPHGPTTHSFKVWLCNERPMQTSVKAVKMTVHDVLRNHTETQTGTIYPIGGGAVVLYQGLGVNAEAEVKMNTSGLFSDAVEVYVVDSFGGEHKLTLPDNVPFPTATEAL